MKSTFGRLFTSVSVILMTSMLLIGIVFQLLTSRYLTKQVISGLQNDVQVLGYLPSARLSVVARPVRPRLQVDTTCLQNM